MSKHNYDVLPLELNIARMLGARIEGYFMIFPGSQTPHKDDVWKPLSDFGQLYPQTKYRIYSEDKHLFVPAKAFVESNFYSLTYKEFKFLVPNQARKINCVILPYGFGVAVDAVGNELGKAYLVTIDYKDELPEEHKVIEAIMDSGKFVWGIVQEPEKFYKL